MIQPRPLFFFHILIVLVLFQTRFLVSALNISFTIISSIESSSAESESDPHPPNFLQDVLKVIAERKKWDLEDIRVSKLEKARYAHFRRYEFRFPIGKKDLSFRYSEKLGAWRSFEGQIQSSNFSRLVQEVSSVADLGSLEVEGPVELLLLGEDRTSLQLPQNTTLAGLKRILVGEGITLQIIGAQEISLPYGSCSGLHNKSSGGYEGRIEFSPFEDLFCTPLLPVHISGPASFIEYRMVNSGSSVEANLLSEETVELNLKKCYPKSIPRELHCPIESLSSTIATTEKLLGRLLGESIHISGEQFSRSIKANVKASTMVTFHLKLERDVRDNDAVWGKAAEWRTKPNLEHVWFDVMARLDGDRLNPLEIKNVKPFKAVDTTAWSNIFLNVSLTEFPVFLIHPQALTLDVKW
ncbi:hypothetical protein V2J09_007170 [Rumex salicifolius]